MAESLEDVRIRSLRVLPREIWLWEPALWVGDRIRLAVEDSRP
ncbi:hypothetical protein [Streptomyces tunisiensis]